MESQYLVSEFMSRTGANPNDAISCLKTWGWDLKRAITDYNDTCTLDLRNNHAIYPPADDITQKNLIKTTIIPVTNINENNIENNLNKITNISSGNRRPTLVKSDSVDIVDYRKLSRGISRATDNINLVSKARTEIAMDFRSNCQKNFEQLNNTTQIDTPDFTFILPNIFNYTEQFRNFLEKDLIECSTLTALEQSNRLNWWVENRICRKLWPLATTGDGNCLLHAASLGMWGFHDRKLTLRKALHSILSNGRCRNALWRRWRFQQTRLNKKAGFVYSEIEWAKEWDELISMSSPEPRNNINNVRSRRFSTSDRHSLISAESIDDSATYESLEEIHILALAHVLRRTIIVVSDTVLKDLNGEAMAPITFGGIYLPFEINADECNRGPLLLAYDMAHFSALVPMENGTDYPPALIPLIDFENILLPIQFCIDPGENFNWLEYDGSEGNWALTEREQVALLKEYLDIVYISTNGSPDDEVFDDLTDDEFDKKFCESEVVISSGQQQQQQQQLQQYNIIDDQPLHQQQQTKSKAAKQLQSVAKQFGSIGKSMSKKIKKNIGSITKIGSSKSNNGNGGTNGSQKLIQKNTLSSGSSTQSFTCTRLLCAKLRIKRHEFQEEMIRNYLEFARTRYLDSEIKRDKQQDFIDPKNHHHQLELLSIGGLNTDAGSSNSNATIVQNLQQQQQQPHNNTNTSQQIYCINAGCKNYASSDTSYLCLECFEMQKQRESTTTFLNNTAPRYGTGKSKFYTQADIISHENIRNIPPVRRLNELDQTLYLSNSTFYNDNLSRGNNTSNTKDLGLITREALYRHGYSPTVRLIDEQPEEQNIQKTVTTSSQSTGTVSVYSPGNTLTNQSIPSQKNLNATTTSSPATAVATVNNTSRFSDSTVINGINKNNINNNSQILDNNSSSSTRSTSFQSYPCRTLGCLFYGTASTNHLCSKCFQLMKTNGQIVDLQTTSSVSGPITKIQVGGTSSAGGTSSTTIYPTATATITKTGSKIMSDI